jgi:hypothetical protein
MTYPLTKFPKVKYSNNKRPEHSRVANPLEPHYKRVKNKTVLPNHPGQTSPKLTPNFMALVTANGKNKAYLHRFKIT